eukprot:scaffold256_cov121-Isochrysis_galbana.AAC.2
MWSHPMAAFTSTPSERTMAMDEHSSKWRDLVRLANCPRGQRGLPIAQGGNVARKNGGAVVSGLCLWHVGRLCLATAPLGLRMWTFHAAPWKGKRAVSSGGVKECVKQASVTSFDAMQPSGRRGVQAGRQAEAGCSCALIALAAGWYLWPPGFARSRGGAARHLKQSVCCGDDGVVKIKVCRPNGPA